MDLENLISLNDVGTFHEEDGGNNLGDLKINKNQRDDGNPWQKSKRKQANVSRKLRYLIKANLSIKTSLVEEPLILMF